MEVNEVGDLAANGVGVLLFLCSSGLSDLEIPNVLDFPKAPEGGFALGTGRG